MFNPFKKFSNSFSLTKNIPHLIDQIDVADSLFNVSPYSAIEEIIILNFYFQKDILPEIEKSSHQLDNYIYFSNGGKATILEVMTNVGRFFYEVAITLEDETYNSIINEISEKKNIYKFLNAQLPSDFTEFICLETSFDNFFYPYKFNQ